MTAEIAGLFSCAIFALFSFVISSQASLFHPSWFRNRNSYMCVPHLANIQNMLGYLDLIKMNQLTRSNWNEDVGFL